MLVALLALSNTIQGPSQSVALTSASGSTNRPSISSPIQPYQPLDVVAPKVTDTEDLREAGRSKSNMLSASFASVWTIALSVVGITVLLQTVGESPLFPAPVRQALRAWSAIRSRNDQLLTTASAFCMYSASDALSQCISAQCKPPAEASIFTSEVCDAAALKLRVRRRLRVRQRARRVASCSAKACALERQSCPYDHEDSGEIPLTSAGSGIQSLRGGSQPPPTKMAWHGSVALDHTRILRSGFTSALLSGYLAVFYFRLLDQVVRLPKSLASIGGPLGGLCSLLPVLTKVAVDVGVYEPVYDTLYMTLQAVLRGDGFSMLSTQLPKVLKVWTIAPRYWGPVDFCNFAFVSLRLRPLYNAVFSIPWSMYLSAVAN